MKKNCWKKKGGIAIYKWLTVNTWKAYLFIKRSHFGRVAPWVGLLLGIENSCVDTHLPETTFSRSNHARLDVVNEELDVVCNKRRSVIFCSSRVCGKTSKLPGVHSSWYKWKSLLNPGEEFLGQVVWVYPFTGQNGPLEVWIVGCSYCLFKSSCIIPMKSGSNLFRTNVDSVLHVAKVAAGFHHIDLSRSRPQAVGVVAGQKPNGFNFQRTSPKNKFVSLNFS